MSLPQLLSSDWNLWNASPPKLESFNPLDYLKYGKTDLSIMKIDFLIIEIILFSCVAAL